MKFKVTIQKKGAPVETRDIEADSRFAVYQQIQGEGGSVVALQEGSSLDFLKKYNISFGSGIRRQKIIVFARNLSAMLTAGLSLGRALSVIERQASNKRLKVVAKDISEAITKGSSFHEALEAHPKVFSNLFTAMTKAGEESGGLADALLVVALQMERSEELSKKIKGAMIYPAIVIFAIIVVAILMLIYVVPTLAATFAQLNVELPLSTQIIISTSNFMAENGILTFGILFSLIAGGIFFIRSRLGKGLILHGAIYLPVIGELVQETFTARAARTLSSLLSAGVPMLNAISITSEVVGAPLFADVLVEAEMRVKKGEQLSAAFADHKKLYPLLMSEMLAVGEETGKLAEMMKQIAEFYEGDVAQKTKDLSTIIEPVLMLLVGLMVGIFAVSMIGPIYSLSSAI